MPGTTKKLDLGPGTYSLTAAQTSLICNEILFKSDPATCKFDGTENSTTTLRLIKDAEATEAARTSREEAAAKAEAEAAATAKAEAEAQAAASAAESQSQVVHITNTGEKYYLEGCRYLKKNKIAIDYDSARAQGYGPYSVRNPG